MDQLTPHARAHRAASAHVAACVAAVGMLIAACTGGGGSPSPAASSASSTAVSASPGTGGAPSATVTLQNLAFSPATLTVAVGTTVHFSNQDLVGHTATNGVNGVADTNALFDLDLPAGTAGTFTFDKPGTYQVTCKIHHFMHMTIVVH